MMKESLARKENRNEDKEEIDFQIEALKESHPFITNEAYWSALKQAKIDYQKFKEIAAPLRAEELNGYDSKDPDQAEARNNARLELTRMIFDCREESFDWLKPLAEAINDSTYVFMPEQRPAYAEEVNPLFGVEKFGIPELLPAAIILSKESWLEAFPQTQRFSEELDAFCVDTGGCNFSRGFFNSENILYGISLSVINGGWDKADALRSTRHESLHAIDFLRGWRKTESILITEVLTFRLDSKFSRPRDKKKIGDPLKSFFDDYLEEYASHWAVDYKKVQAAADKIRELIAIVEYAFGPEKSFNAVTQMLLNSESIDDFEKNVTKAVSENNFEEI